MVNNSQMSELDSHMLKVDETHHEDVGDGGVGDPVLAAVEDVDAVRLLVPVVPQFIVIY